MCEHEINPILIDIRGCSLSTVQYCEKCQSVVAWSIKEITIMKSDNDDLKISGMPRHLSFIEKEQLR
jgi:hypothetical protein